ncbi:MAG: sugar transferase [Actinomycetota bacterium]|nr:sugar transferase [Actinomycetota bacterium]
MSDVACLISVLLVLQMSGAAWLGSSVFLGGAAVWVAVFAVFGLYRVPRVAGRDDLREVVTASTLGSALLVLVFLDGRSGLRPVFGLTLVGTVLLEIATRSVWKSRLKRWREGGSLALRTLIVGTNDEADRVARSLLSPGSGFIPLGYVAGFDRIGTANGFHVLGRIDDLTAVVRDHGADCLFVASSDVSPTEMSVLARVARHEQLDVKIAANLPDILPSRVNVEVSDSGVAALSLTTARLSPGKAAVKRLFDVALGTGLLVATLPMMVVIAALVRLSSRGPILFRQDRITKDGRRFSILKFRTMFVEGDADVTPDDFDPTRTYFKMKDDPRVTKVGRVLRRYSLDELPQLWNVLRGDLSLVGPRPLWAAQVDGADDTFQHRHEVPAGLTGWWQVNGRSSVDVDEALKMDIFYIENWSLWLDLSILLRTIPVVLRSRAAY